MVVVPDFCRSIECEKDRKCLKLRVFELLAICNRNTSKMDNIGYEWGSRGSVWADIKTGRSYALQEAFYKVVGPV